MRDEHTTIKKVTRTAKTHPALHRLLKAHKITIPCIARAASVDQFTARRALSANTYAGVGIGKTERIRERTEALLRAAGWSGESESLWRFEPEFPQRAA